MDSDQQWEVRKVKDIKYTVAKEDGSEDVGAWNCLESDFEDGISWNYDYGSVEGQKACFYPHRDG